jgi:hypothetical protein
LGKQLKARNNRRARREKRNLERGRGIYKEGEREPD